MTTLLVTTEEYWGLDQDRPLLLCAVSVPSYKRTRSLDFALPSCRTQHAPLLLSEKVYQNVSIIYIVSSTWPVGRKTLNWLLSTLPTTIVLPNLVLELTMRLWATFRFAAGQKSISADDLVVFAEMFYLFDASHVFSWMLSHFGLQ